MKEILGHDVTAMIRDMLPKHPDEALPRSEICERTGLSLGAVREALNNLIQLNAVVTTSHGPRSYKYYLADRSTSTATVPAWLSRGPLKDYDKKLNDFRALCEGGR